MVVSFKKAIKHEAKLRLALAGPAGSGKTFTALTLADALADGQPVAVIDTERGSASKYADQFSFDVVELDSFSPQQFIEAIQSAEQAGYAVLVIDSISHEWNGSGGILEIVDAVAKRMKTANTFSAWGEGTPKHNSFIDAILRCKMHVICTMRSKEEHVQERVNDRTVIRRVGMAPIQRDGIMYEFDIAAELDYEHTMLVTKSRFSLLSDAVIRKPGREVAETIKTWLSGTPALSPVVEAPTQPQANVDEPRYPVEIIRLLSEFKQLESAWCNNHPNWDRVLLTKVLELQTLEPFPVLFDEDDINRVEIYVESVKQKKAKAGK